MFILVYLSGMIVVTKRYEDTNILLQLLLSYY